MEPEHVVAESYYMVIRSDDNGHTFLIQDLLSLDGADAVLRILERGHKQFYSKLSYTSETRVEVITRNGIIE